MHLIDTPTATVDNEFTNGDPITGIPPTIVDDDWLNAIQAEIANVITGSPGTPALYKPSNTQLLAAIRAIAGGVRRMQYAFDVSEADHNVPVKAWFAGGTCFQRAETCIDPSVEFGIDDKQVIVWWRVGLKNVTAAPITIPLTIVFVDDGANVYWNGASVLSVDTAGGTATADITINAGVSAVLDVLYYNKTTSDDNPGVFLFTAGSPFPTGIATYDPGTVFA